jgi:type VI secretion system protein ImpM
MPGQAVNELSLAELLAGTGLGAAGWYGKMAMLGDFASRRLPQNFVDVCDQWLAQGIDASRAQLGDSWLDVYLHGPIWRFAWAPGVLDEQWWFGVLMPSVDKVGRYFPLVIARPATGAPDSSEGLHALAAWYAHLSAAALHTFATGATLEEFESSLASAPPIGEPGWADVPNGTPLPGRTRYVVQTSPSLPQWMGALVGAEALQRFGGHTLWWPDSASTPDNSFSVARGLPAPEHFAEMLGGHW